MQDKVCTLYCCSQFQKSGKNNGTCWLFYSGPNTKPQLCQNFTWLVFDFEITNSVFGFFLSKYFYRSAVENAAFDQAGVYISFH